MPQLLSSPANPLLKDVRQALRRGTLTSQGYCVAEGPHLLDEARRSGSRIRTLLVAESAVARIIGGMERIAIIEDGVFEKLAATETTQGVIALIDPPEWTMAQLLRPDALVVVLDGIQDPGNAGTILRAAEAFGASGIVFLKGSVSPFNAKVLRASAGSLFRVPFVHGMDAACVPTLFEERGIVLYAGVPGDPAHQAMALPKADLTHDCALIVGNEGSGVGERFRSTARLVTIPTVGVESLNAGVAAAILLYEARRQRDGYT
ncbi:MAG: RNA methyltransferase [Acidobacteriota bacterium]|nr:RNA methyltransferase [Acidobacteriota bacterium]